MSVKRQQQPQIKFYANNEETRKAFKVYCARKGLSIQQVLEAYMMQLLDKEDAE
ncbi:hypothetical protein GXP70_04755 [Paenibacillus lycopersici]|uniref:Protein CopB n=1 Tax=Paenibacillus lycopersici TaxID=2704462 RepID=A0A6C0FQC9_9BACL|nr:hypothetical protein [Paenibacillus lycopersici]QHT59346.1 hypothetical protein GXP70_04755 [Paenibacillus lycopersici]